MGVSVTYKLTGTGWAECYLEVDDQSAHLTASYLSDALGDLVRSMTDLLRGVPESTVSFAEEPGEYQWRFRSLPPDRVSIRILWFDDWPTDDSAPADRAVMEAGCRLRTLAGAVLAASQQVLREYGEQGYRREWVNHPFPLEKQAELKRLLSEGAGRAS